MYNRKLIKTTIVGVAFGIASVALTSSVFAASDTTGLVSLSLQGAGVGAIATGDCNGIACPETETCACLSATYSLTGNQGFGGGDFTLLLSVVQSVTVLPVLTGEPCSPATGFGTISNKSGKSTVSVQLSGLECPTLGDSDIFNASYVVVGGTGPFSTASGGTGTVNGSQIPASGSLGQVLIAGSLQKKTSVPVTTPTPTPTKTPTPTPTPTPSPTPSGSPTPTGSPTPSPTPTPSPSPTPI